MTAALLLLVVPVAMSLAQNAALLASRRPMRWALGGSGLPAAAESATRAALYVSAAGVLAALPAIKGASLFGYYAVFLEAPSRPLDFVWGLCASVLFLALLHLGWLAAGVVRFEVRHGARRVMRRLAAAPAAALLVAVFEELLFRAAVLADMTTDFGPYVGIAAGAAIFAAAHYIRVVKRYWTIPGHVALGGLLCVAFLSSGGLWLPMGLHAGGVLVLMVVRPFVRYVGPPALVGASIYPYAGLAGIAALSGLTAAVIRRYGPPT